MSVNVVPDAVPTIDPSRSTSYLTRPTLSVAAAQLNPTWDAVTLVATGVPGVVGGVVSACVVVVTGELGEDRLPDVSLATTS